MQRLSVRGTPRQVGRALGERGREAFASVIRPGDSFQRLRRHLPHGWLAAVAGRVKEAFPAIWAELGGLAEGLDQPLDDVLLWNCRGDLSPTGPEGCSSVAVDAGGVRWLAHNEDGDPALREHCFVLEAEPAAQPAFMSFCYPGSLPGHALGMNNAGFAFTVNNLRLTERPVGIPRMVTARALLACDSVAAALDLLRSVPRCGGFHFMMADVRDGAPVSVEAPFHRICTEAAAPVAVHANHMIHSGCRGLPQVVTDSSKARQQRLQEWRQELAQSPGRDELLAILADRSDPDLPIFRIDPNDPDWENTLATALFRLDASGILGSVLPGPDGAVTAQCEYRITTTPAVDP